MIGCFLPSLIAKKPTFAQLTKIEMQTNEREENIWIINSVAPQWKELGALLDFDATGRTLELTEAKYQKEGPVACCQAIFRCWLKGNGKECTWKVLTELLCDIGESELANQVKDAIEVS